MIALLVAAVLVVVGIRVALVAGGWLAPHVGRALGRAVRAARR